MRYRAPITLLAATGLLAVAACQPAEEAEPAAEGEAAATETVRRAAPPDTTADAVWAHLQQAAYRDNWALWPEKGELYAGGEPHGMLLTTYVNDAAAEALEAGAGAMPPGAIVVKENFMPDSTLAAVTVMYKAAGFDPDNNDWWWLKRNADGSVDAAGRGQGCINCHAGAADNDYILTSSLQP